MITFFKITITTILVFLYLNTTYSQISQNMSLIANVNQHYTTTLYSACWGYRAPNGREYAILGCPGGTAFIDITDTTNVHEVGFQTWLSSSWREMKTFSHYAYIVTEASGTGQGLQIIDLQYLPDSIHYVSTFTYSGYTHTHSIQQDGPYLYLNGGNVSPGGNNVGGVTAIDLTVNPEAPVKRGSWSSEYIHDCRVRNDTMYACNIYDPPGTISVINVANKDNLTLITNWVNNPNPFPHNCALLPGRTYILTTDETQTPNGKLKVWNISDLNNVTLAATWQPPTALNAIVHNVEIYGNYALVAHYSAGVRLVDISNPLVPVEVAYYDTYPANNNANFNGCWGVYMFPSGKIIASDRQTGLYVFRTTVNVTGFNNNNSTVPENYSLSQNYPNPFNPMTNVKFQMPNEAFVKLIVFDVLGREAATLVNEQLNAGTYEVNWDASNYPSGVYFYKLVVRQAGSSTGDGSKDSPRGYVKTKKMVLIK